jgi:pyridoxamine 5'-phosphate oxidase
MPNLDFNPPEDPWALFAEWYKLADAAEPNDPNAMALATVGAHAMPSIRVVLLKAWDPKGMVFFTNRESRKGEQMKAIPQAALCLHWKSLHRQIAAEGLVSEVSEAESETYFASRPRDSQIGAWASQQSRPLADRILLEARMGEFEETFEGKTVPRPPYWGGYRLTPLMIEFWQQRDFRLHDRVVYRRPHVKALWTIGRLYP